MSEPLKRYICESWQTPEFCAYWAATGKLAQEPRGNERFSQQHRYECIAKGLDPDRARNWPLAWKRLTERKE